MGGTLLSIWVRFLSLILRLLIPTRRKTEKECMWGDIPVEIQIEVLRRLPIKSLLRFRCVCKSWYALITDPSTFTGNHAIVYNKPHKLLLLGQSQPLSVKKQFFSLHYDNDTLEEHMKVEFPFKSSSVGFVSSCNGLLYFAADKYVNGVHYAYARNNVLWNPCIRKYLILPKPNIGIYSESYMFVIAFGHEPKTNDYKLLRIVCLGRAAVPPVAAELYSLSARSWRTIEAPPPSYLPGKYDRAHVFLNGAVHWILHWATSKMGTQFRNLIVLFDMGNEVFKEMMVPQSEVDASLVRCGELLGLIYSSGLDFRGHCFCIWVMNEYGQVNSWTQKYTICLPLWEGPRGIVGFPEGPWGILGFPEYDRVLVMTGIGLVSINPMTRKRKRHGFWSTKLGVYAYDYKESLTLLQEEGEALLGPPVKPQHSTAKKGVDLQKLKNRVVGMWASGWKHLQKMINKKPKQKARERI